MKTNPPVDPEGSLLEIMRSFFEESARKNIAPGEVTNILLMNAVYICQKFYQGPLNYKDFLKTRLDHYIEIG